MAPKEDSKDSLSRKRAELIVKVRSGQITATEAAAALGVSRKTYYEWEERALQGMLTALENGSPGRPRTETDGETEKLKKRVQELETELQAHQTALKIRELLDPVFPRQGTKEATRGKTAGKKKRLRKS